MGSQIGNLGVYSRLAIITAAFLTGQTLGGDAVGPVQSAWLDSSFARLSLEYLMTGDSTLPDRIAQTAAAKHLAAHAQRVTIVPPGPGPGQVVDRILSELGRNRLDVGRLVRWLDDIEQNVGSQERCWSEASAFLPRAALDDAALFLAVGYDIGVAVSGEASLNLAHPRFASRPQELWFYCVHELHHAGVQRYHDIPEFAQIRSTRDLAALVQYLTMLEGTAVHAAMNWRREVGALDADPDYLALGDPDTMVRLEEEYFKLYQELVAKEERPLREDDWGILAPMSEGDRLWYRVGGLMARRLESALGLDGLKEIVVAGPERFFDAHAATLDETPKPRAGAQPI